MITAECIKDIKLAMADGEVFELNAGEKYVSSDIVFEQIRRLFPDSWGKVESFDKEHYREYMGEDLSGKTFMCWRTGGIGDVLFLLPCVRLLKEKYPTCTIITASASPNKEAYRNNPHISEFYNIPFPFKVAQRADYHLTFQGIIEENPRASEITAVDLFLERFKFNPAEIPDEMKVPQIFLTKDEIEFAEKFLTLKNFNDKYKIAYQVFASSPIRTFPLRRTIDIISEVLNDKDNAVIMFGGPREVDVHKDIYNVFPEEKKERIVSTALEEFSLRKSFAVMSKVDLCVGPDSSLMHMAGAFQIPIIGIYGPFPSRVRLAYYKKAIGLEPNVACSPCFTHGNSPCYKAIANKESPCFSVLSDRSMYESINLQKMLKTGKPFNTDKIITYNEFEKLIKDHLELSKFMIGKGADIGSGKRSPFHENYDIDTVDINPLYRPDFVCDVNSLSALGVDKYDFLVASFLLNCVPDPANAISQMIQTLKNNGYLIIHMPDPNVYPNPSEETFKYNGHGGFLARQNFEGIFSDKQRFKTVHDITHVSEGLTKDNFELAKSAEFHYGFCLVIQVTKEVEENAVT